MRCFFLVLFAISLALFLEYVINLNSQWSENVGWIALALSSLLCIVLTRPVWRNAFCIWLSGTGRSKVGDRSEALNAAMLIWVDFESSTARTEPEGIQA